MHHPVICSFVCLSVCPSTYSSHLSAHLSDHHYGCGVWRRSGDRCRLSDNHWVRTTAQSEMIPYCTGSTPNPVCLCLFLSEPTSPTEWQTNWPPFTTGSSAAGQWTPPHITCQSTLLNEQLFGESRTPLRIPWTPLTDLWEPCVGANCQRAVEPIA